MGLSEPSLTTIPKPFSPLSHCKVPCDSPCCTKTCGEDNHCVFNADTHEHVNSDSDDEDEDTGKKCSKLVFKQTTVIIYLFASVVQVVVQVCEVSQVAWET